MGYGSSGTGANLSSTGELRKGFAIAFASV
jgi:hypothetical protein